LLAQTPPKAKKGPWSSGPNLGSKFDDIKRSS